MGNKDLDTTSIWIPEPRPNATQRLVIAHHAGGSSGAYLRFAKSFSAPIEVILVELPGRGARHGQGFITNFAVAVNAITTGLKALPRKPTAYFGHSMGALILFEVAKLMAASGQAPVHLFLSAVRHAPAYGTDLKEPRSDDWLLNRLKQNEGTPREVLESPEMLAIMVPIFRADYLLIDSYEYPGAANLTSPLTIFGGTDDPGVNRADLEAWQCESNGPFEVVQFAGGHFYTLTNYDELKLRIQKRLGIASL